MLTCLVEYLGGDFLARSAAGGDTQLALQGPEVRAAVVRRLADLLIGDGVADTDVHEINQLVCLMTFNRKCE